MNSFSESLKLIFHTELHSSMLLCYPWIFWSWPLQPATYPMINFLTVYSFDSTVHPVTTTPIPICYDDLNGDQSISKQTVDDVDNTHNTANGSIVFGKNNSRITTVFTSPTTLMAISLSGKHDPEDRYTVTITKPDGSSTSSPPNQVIYWRNCSYFQMLKDCSLLNTLFDAQSGAEISHKLMSLHK